MGQDWLIANRRWLAPLGIVAALALLLAWWRPWQTSTPATPSPVARIPTRAPTATPVLVRVPLPTGRPQPNAPLPTPTPGTPVVAVAAPSRAATPTARVVASGTLLYLGFVNGHEGVVASNTDGSSQRLLVPGIFGSLLVSPDGTRLATIGPIPNGEGAYQLAVFAPDGQILARYLYGRGTRGALTWSPSGRYLLGSFLSTGDGQAAHWETWVYGDDGAWQVVPPDPAITFPHSWTPDDRIAFLAGADPAQERMRTLWTTDVTGGDVRKVYEWAFIPLGWNRDGSLLFALASDRPDAPDTALNHLIVIELPSGYVRYLANADTLAAGALGLPIFPGTYRFDFAIPSPDGRLFAIGIARLFESGTPTPRAPLRLPAIIFMRVDGLITGTATLPPGDLHGLAAWSPDSSRFALFVADENQGDGQILALDTTGDRLAAFPIGRTSTGLIPPQIAWSRDAQWLAYASNLALFVAAIPLDDSILIVPGGTQPAWQP